MLLVEPVVVRPLLAEWNAEKTEITAELERAEGAKSRPACTKRLNEAERRYRAFLNRLRGFTVLDPACGSGARRLVELRDRWLNPPEWVEWVDEPVPGYPRRPVPRDEDAAKALRKRTLTNLYNARPQWLADAHATLDAAVAAAYGWPTDITDDHALRELLALNSSCR